ncbi:MAG: UdgX family uracil-DNA binding protein [Kofleriaceae bacterium]
MRALQRATPDEFPGAEQFLPVQRSLPALRVAAETCRGCPLYRDATQVVFGEGKATSRVILVGEQPGDAEDRTGRPFVGPSGRLLDEALERARIARDDVYITNAVKHFKFTRRGKRRIHDKPTRYEVAACHAWLEAELSAIDPDVVVVLGATAAQALLGSDFRVSKSRGVRFESKLGPCTFATVHPAAVLRAPDDASRAEARAAFFSDLDAVGRCLREPVRHDRNR